MSFFRLPIPITNASLLRFNSYKTSLVGLPIPQNWSQHLWTIPPSLLSYVSFIPVDSTIELSQNHNHMYAISRTPNFFLKSDVRSVKFPICLIIIFSHMMYTSITWLSVSNISSPKWMHPSECVNGNGSGNYLGVCETNWERYACVITLLISSWLKKKKKKLNSHFTQLQHHLKQLSLIRPWHIFFPWLSRPAILVFLPPYRLLLRSFGWFLLFSQI